MIRVLILGANGQLARHTAAVFLLTTDAAQTLYLRRANRLKNSDGARTRIVVAMHVSGLKRLIFISSMGIYDEVPGERYRSVLDPYRDSATVIESSDLEYTVLRPGWFTHDAQIKYTITHKGEPFKGHDVSLNSLADLIVKLSMTPGMHVRRSLGVANA